MDGRDSTNGSQLSRTLTGVLVLLWLSVFLNYIDRSNLSIAAPQLKSELGLSATQLGVLLSAFFWTYACLQIPAGWLVDHFDVKWIFASGFLIWSAATAATGVLRSFAALLAVRVILGVGESVGTQRFGELDCGIGPVFWAELRNAVWRNADGQVWMASFFRDARLSQFVVDRAMVDMDAASEGARG